MSSKQINRTFAMLKTFMSIFIAMLLAFIVILLVSKEPLTALKAFLLGPVSSLRRFGNLLEYAIPVTFTSLAICIMFSVGMSSVIAEGCAFFGGLIATAVVLKMGLSGMLATAASIVIAGLVCAVIAGIPMYLRLKFDADLFVGSMMLNYVVLYLGMYILNYSLRDPEYGMAASYEMPKEAMLGRLINGTQVSTGLILAVIALVLGYLFMDRTSLGYQIKLTGQNTNFSKYAGTNIFGICMLVSVIGGFLSGAGGAVEVLGRNPRFQWMALPGYGWDGILIATIANFKPKFLPFAIFFIAYIKTGADVMNRSSDMVAELVAVIQALMILLIAAKGFLAKTQQRLTVKNTKRLAAETEG